MFLAMLCKSVVVGVVLVARVLDSGIRPKYSYLSRDQLEGPGQRTPGISIEGRLSVDLDYPTGNPRGGSLRKSHPTWLEAKSELIQLFYYPVSMKF